MKYEEQKNRTMKTFEEIYRDAADKRRWYMTVLWISFAALYALGMLWLAYQIRTAPSDLDLWGEEIE